MALSESVLMPDSICAFLVDLSRHLKEGSLYFISFHLCVFGRISESTRSWIFVFLSTPYFLLLICRRRDESFHLPDMLLMYLL